MDKADLYIYTLSKRVVRFIMDRVVVKFCLYKVNSFIKFQRCWSVEFELTVDRFCKRIQSLCTDLKTLLVLNTKFKINFYFIFKLACKYQSLFIQVCLNYFVIVNKKFTLRSVFIYFPCALSSISSSSLSIYSFMIL